MTQEEEKRFKELWNRLSTLTGEEWKEFMALHWMVPINLKTGEIPLLDEAAQELRSAAD